MEIKVKKYVRTESGFIGKVIQVYKQNGLLDRILLDSRTIYCEDEGIIKHSNNLIDLIEIGDYVNGEKVIDIFEIYNKNEEQIGRKLLTEYRMAQYKGTDLKYYLYQDDIKDIVTREQFNSRKYIVGGENEKY